MDRFIQSLNIEAWDFALRIIQKSGDVEAWVGLEYAKVRPRKSEVPVAVAGTWVSTAGVSTHVAHTPSTTDNQYFWVRWGVVTRLTSSSGTRGWVEVELRATKRQCSALVGQREFEVNPETDVNNPTLVILSGFRPALGITKLRLRQPGRGRLRCPLTERGRERAGRDQRAGRS